MAYNLSPNADAFLAQGRMVTVAAIREDPTTVPAGPGIYGWWFDEPFCALLEQRIPELCSETSRANKDRLSQAGFELLYVGICPGGRPRDGAESRGLRNRLLNHCRGPIATSTLRRTLAAFVVGQENLSIERTASGKVRMSAEDEANLTRWMADHARVTWLITPEPWIVEEELLTHGPTLPLNIRGSSGEWARKLTAIRAESVQESLPGAS